MVVLQATNPKLKVPKLRYSFRIKIDIFII